MKQLRRQKDELNAQLKQVSEALQEIEKDTAHFLENEGLERYVGKEGTFMWRHVSSYKVPKDTESRREFFDYLKEKGLYENLITVNSATLNAFARAEEEEHGDELDFQIPGIEKNEFIKTSFRRA
jgi:hypothetical protein